MHVLVAEGLGTDDFCLRADQFPAILGRSTDAAIYIEDPWISRQHCSIEFDGTTVMVRDVSRNGTIVNGARIQQQIDLVAGDILRLGHTSFQIREINTEKQRQSGPLSRFRRKPAMTMVSRDMMASSRSDSALSKV